MLCNIVAVAWLGMGLRGWILSQLIGQVFGLVLFAVPFLREKWPPVQGRVLRQLLILGLPMVPSFFFMYVIQQGNRYMVEVFSGWEDLGVYMIGIGLATASSFAVSSFQTSWTPYFMSFRDHPVEAETAFGRATTYYCYFMGLAAVCFFAFAQPVTELMANAKFHDAWLTVGSLALANILAGATNLLTPAQYFSEKLSHLMVMQAIAAAASLGINAGIIWWGGVAYAGFALALSYVFLLLLHGWWNKRGISMRLPIRYEWGRLGAVAAALALVAALTLLFPAHGVIAGFTQGCILVLAFCVLLWLLLTPENRRYLLNLVRRTPAEQKTAS
jgi:O-antigen/teichoic acid export membrane protein